MQKFRVIYRILIGLLLTTSALFFALFWLVERQGHRAEFWPDFKGAHVVMDERGIPTIDADSWEKVVEAQGYVVASERLWQMDLIRRKAGGRLAAWFGEAAFERDKAMQLQDRQALALSDAEALPAAEKLYCEAYARGVNRFIDENPYKWGIEYILLRQKPESWRCADSLLVLFEMVDTLTSKAERDGHEAVWRAALPASWANFLFTRSHPWNKPLFGADDAKPIQLPLAADSLPVTALPETSVPTVAVKSGNGAGSNNWAWRGKGGCFLANDPHLGYSVPGIWYAQRLRINAKDWAVGVAIPGIPGLTLGMNPSYAWAFTNTGEDIDDYLQETLNAAQTEYVERQDGEHQIWQPLIRKTFKIEVKGEAEPRLVEGLFTRRGPLSQQPQFGEGYFSRQWLALKPGMLQLPSMEFMRGSSWDDFNRAADAMRLPAQNVLMVNRACDIGLRITGTGVKRQTTDSVSLLPATSGAWAGIEDAGMRRRLLLPASSGVASLATANQRIWVDKPTSHDATTIEHAWFADDRAARINEVLGETREFTHDDMRQLQLDTKGRFRSELMHWMALHATAKDAASEALIKGLKEWDGGSHGNIYFAMSTRVETELMNILLGRVMAQYLPIGKQEVPYAGTMPHAWLLATLTSPDGFKVFGLNNEELANHLLQTIVSPATPIVPHARSNRWIVQHPFVGRVPVIGSLFKIDEAEQWGAGDLVNAERPTFGPSVRLIWDLHDPIASTWIMPVGQSGHLGSVHYRDMRKLWFAGETLPIFSVNEKSDWGF